MSSFFCIIICDPIVLIILPYTFTYTNNRKEELDTLSAIEEFLDFSNNALDEIWRLPYQYPQNRMKNVLDLLCKCFYFIIFQY